MNKRQRAKRRRQRWEVKRSIRYRPIRYRPSPFGPIADLFTKRALESLERLVSATRDPWLPEVSHDEDCS